MAAKKDFAHQSILRHWMNPAVLTEAKVSQFRKSFRESIPFPHLFIDDFLLEDKLDAVTIALSEEDFEYRESDLFSLHQTDDLAGSESEVLQSFIEFLRSEQFISYMTSITDIELTQRIDCVGNIYTDTDYLLCHDDELHERKIAYIYYLTDMNVSTGGAFHLYNTVNSEPQEIVKSLYPRQNRFFFFKVTRRSFHEVGEVISEEDYRVSISGWFRDD